MPETTSEVTHGEGPPPSSGLWPTPLQQLCSEHREGRKQPQRGREAARPSVPPSPHSQWQGSLGRREGQTGRTGGCPVQVSRRPLIAQVLSAPQDTLQPTAARGLCQHQRPHGVCFLQARDTLHSSHDAHQPCDPSQPSPGRCGLQGKRHPPHSAPRARWEALRFRWADATLPCRRLRSPVCRAPLYRPGTDFPGSAPSLR